MPPTTAPTTASTFIPKVEEKIVLPTRDEIAADIKTIAALREKYLAIQKPHGFTAAGALHTSLSALGHLVVALEAKPATPEPEPPVHVLVDTSKELAEAEAKVAEILNPTDAAPAPESSATESAPEPGKEE